MVLTEELISNLNNVSRSKKKHEREKQLSREKQLNRCVHLQISTNAQRTMEVVSTRARTLWVLTNVLVVTASRRNTPVTIALVRYYCYNCVGTVLLWLFNLTSSLCSHILVAYGNNDRAYIINSTLNKIGLSYTTPNATAVKKERYKCVYCGAMLCLFNVFV